jgi:hypothetical protein
VVVAEDTMTGTTVVKDVVTGGRSLEVDTFVALSPLEPSMALRDVVLTEGRLGVAKPPF